MVHDKVIAPQAGEVGNCVEVKRFSVCWGKSWGKDSSAAEGLFFLLL